MADAEMSELNPNGESAISSELPRPPDPQTAVFGVPSTNLNGPEVSIPSTDALPRKRARDTMNPSTHVSDLDRPPVASNKTPPSPADGANHISKGQNSYRIAAGASQWLMADKVDSFPIPMQPASENVPVNPRCPKIQFSEEEVKSFYRPWSRALVVKPLEKTLSFITMKRRLEFL
ncbi:hypothetical protein LINPERHAP2_LOCUS11890 [Linum perenne]